MGIQSDLTALSTKEATLTSNKVSRFAYTQNAYDNDNADGVTVYDVNQEQNIPVGTPSIMKVNDTVVEKGWRARASSITRMLMNHFLGRLSYNVNKVNDIMASLLSSLSGSLGSADGIATLDANGRIPYSQLPESAVEYKGGWNANTNTPTLADGTGTNGDMYIVEVAGTQNLGSGNITFFVNDRVIYNGNVWQRFSAGDVKSVNGVTPSSSTGNVEITGADIDVSGSDTRKISSVMSSLETAVTNLQGNFSDVPIENSGKAFTAGGAFGFFNRNNKALKWLGQVFGGRLGMYWSFTPYNYGYGMPIYAVGDFFFTYSGLWSEDGKDWAEININGIAFSELQAMSQPFYFNGKYICTMRYGNSNTVVNIYSSDGKNWEVGNCVDLDGTPVTLRSSAYSIMDYFVQDDYCFIIPSASGMYRTQDGITWTEVINQANYLYKGLYVESLGIITVSTEDRIIWSEDYGETWANGVNSQTTYARLEFAYGAGVIVCSSQNAGLMWSADGKTWTQCTGINASYGTGIVASPIRRLLAYHDGIFVCGTYGGGNTYHGMWWSTDGKAWTQCTGIGSTAVIFSVDWYRGLWFAKEKTNSTGKYWYSENGKAWTAFTFQDAVTPDTSYFNAGVKEKNGVYLCATGGNSNTGYLVYSLDGKRWNKCIINKGDAQNMNATESLVYNNACWVLSTSSGIYRSGLEELDID